MQCMVWIVHKGDWAAWQPGKCQVGRLVRWPGGPLGEMLKSVNRLTPTPLTGESVERGGEKGARDKVTKRRLRGKEGLEQGRGPSRRQLRREGSI